MNVVESEACLRAAGGVVAVDLGVPAATEHTAMPDDVIRRVPHVTAFLVQLVDEYTNIARLGHEHAVMDAIQRHRAWSPNAVRVGTVIRDTTSRRRVAPDIELHQNVARRLAVLLGES